MLKIMSSDADSFKLIQDALDELVACDPKFMSFFDVAEEVPSERGDVISVVLKNRIKFKSDLNRGRKYMILLPSILTIDSFEFVKTFDRDPRPPRRPITNLLIQTHIEGNNIEFLFLINGFNNDNIRVIRPFGENGTSNITLPSEPQDNPTNPPLNGDDEAPNTGN